MNNNEHQADEQVSQSERNRHRRLRSYFTTEYPNLRDSIYDAAPDVDFQTAENVLEQLAKRINEYPGRAYREQPAFVEWATGWVGRYARLLVTIREMAPALIGEAQSAVPGLSTSDYCVAARRVERHIHELLVEDADDLLVWSSDWAVYEARGLAGFREWVNDPIVKHSIYDGLWTYLRSAADLGLGQSDDNGRNVTVESLYADVLLWMWEHAGMLAAESAYPGGRAKGQAEAIAHGWRTERVREKKRYASYGDVERQQVDRLERPYVTPIEMRKLPKPDPAAPQPVTAQLRERELPAQPLSQDMEKEFFTVFAV